MTIFPLVDYFWWHLAVIPYCCAVRVWKSHLCIVCNLLCCCAFLLAAFWSMYKKQWGIFCSGHRFSIFNNQIPGICKAAQTTSELFVHAYRAFPLDSMKSDLIHPWSLGPGSWTRWDSGSICVPKDWPLLHSHTCCQTPFLSYNTDATNSWLFCKSDCREGCCLDQCQPGCAVVCVETVDEIGLGVSGRFTGLPIGWPRIQTMWMMREIGWSLSIIGDGEKQDE